MPGIGKTWTPFANAAVRPVVEPIVRVAEAAALTLGSLCEVAITVSPRPPDTAKPAAFVVIAIGCELAPGRER